MRKYSQLNEEQIISDVLSEIGITNRCFVEFGASDGVANSNTAHLLNQGWRGLMMDGKDFGNPGVRQEFITAENIKTLLAKYETPIQFDVLSIDVDGNDIHILKSLLLKYTPRVIVAEYNPAISSGENRTIKYNPGHVWGNNDYYGGSFEAFRLLGRDFGYRIVADNGLNIFMVHNMCLCSLPEIVSHVERHDHPSIVGGEWVEYIPIKDAFNGDDSIRKEFIRLRDAFGVKRVVELGTYHGTTTAWFSDNFSEVVTIEISEPYFIKSRDRLKWRDNIEVVMGDTLNELPRILLESDKKTIVFVDSHWYENPMLRELKIIKDSGRKPIIVIHDFFVEGKSDINKPSGLWGFDIYPDQGIVYNWDYIKAHIEDIFGSEYIAYANDSLCESAPRGCVFICPK